MSHKLLLQLKSLCSMVLSYYLMGYTWVSSGHACKYYTRVEQTDLRYCNFNYCCKKLCSRGQCCKKTQRFIIINVWTIWSNKCRFFCKINSSKNRSFTDDLKAIFQNIFFSLKKVSILWKQICADDFSFCAN